MGKHIHTHTRSILQHYFFEKKKNFSGKCDWLSSFCLEKTSNFHRLKGSGLKTSDKNYCRILFNPTFSPLSWERHGESMPTATIFLPVKNSQRCCHLSNLHPKARSKRKKKFQMVQTRRKCFFSLTLSTS